MPAISSGVLAVRMPSLTRPPGVTNWEAVDTALADAARMALAITAQTDRAYQDPVRVSWFLGIPFRVKTFYYSNARRAFGRRLARSLIGCNVLNAGAFALARDTPHWAAWKRLVADALVKGRPSRRTASP